MSAVFVLRGMLVVTALLVGVKGASLLAGWPPSAQAMVPGLATAPATPASALIRTAQAAGPGAPPPGTAAGGDVPRRAAAVPRPQAPAAPAPVEANAPAAPPPDDAVALALRARRQTLDERERLLATREAVVAATEQRVRGRIEQLSGLQARLEQNERTLRERDEAHWASLARLYETMRPREAAAVFNDMDLPLLAQIVNRMREQKAAPVFGAMEPERVRALTTELARMRATRPEL